MDAKEDGREEWVAAEAIEVRCTPWRMYEALVWDGEQTGSEDVYTYVACWMVSHSHWGDEQRVKFTADLKGILQELAERYADQVLWPEYVQKVKNGNFEG